MMKAFLAKMLCCVDKKAQGTRKCVIKRKTKFKDCKRFLESNKKISRSQQSFRNELHIVFTEKTNKVTLSTIRSYMHPMEKQHILLVMGSEQNPQK